MKFLERMHNLNQAIEKWMFSHPWECTFITAGLITLCLFTMRYSITLAFIPILLNGIACVFLMTCDTIFMVKSGYKPARCDKCGHVLSEKRP